MVKDEPKASMTIVLDMPTDHYRYHEITESLNLPILRMATYPPAESNGLLSNSR